MNHLPRKTFYSLDRKTSYTSFLCNFIYKVNIFLAGKQLPLRSGKTGGGGNRFVPAIRILLSIVVDYFGMEKYCSTSFSASPVYSDTRIPAIRFFTGSGKLSRLPKNALRSSRVIFLPRVKAFSFS